MKERTAQCACGQVQVITMGEPNRVIGCHCYYCQKRTGSVFQVSAWFRDEQIVKLAGTTLAFSESPRSKGVKYQCCPVCGSTVHWTFSHVQGYRSIAVGCFTDPQFPTPSFEMHTEKRHPWVCAIPGAEQFPQWPPRGYLE